MALSHSLSDLLKKALFRQTTRHARLQSLWSRLHTLSIFGMNYGGGLIESSGEVWVLSNVIGSAEHREVFLTTNYLAIRKSLQ